MLFRTIILLTIGLYQISAFAWDTYPMRPRVKKTDPIARMQPAFDIPTQPEDFVWQTQVIEGEADAKGVPVLYKNPSGYLVIVGNTNPGQTIEVEGVHQQGRILFYSIKSPISITLAQGKPLQNDKDALPSKIIWVSGRNLKITGRK